MARILPDQGVQAEFESMLASDEVQSIGQFHAAVQFVIRQEDVAVEETVALDIERRSVRIVGGRRPRAVIELHMSVVNGRRREQVSPPGQTGTIELVLNIAP